MRTPSATVVGGVVAGCVLGEGALRVDADQGAGFATAREEDYKKDKEDNGESYDYEICVYGLKWSLWERGYEGRGRTVVEPLRWSIVRIAGCAGGGDVRCS